MISKEEKIISKFTQKIDLFHLDFVNQEFIDEYTNLLEEYKKLSRRFNKTMKMNDIHGMSVLKEGEAFQEKATTTVKLAKEKILSNITEQRKTRELYESKLEQSNEMIKQLQKQLSLANQKLSQFDKFQENDTSNSLAHVYYDINLPQYSNFSLKDLIFQEVEIKIQEEGKSIFVAQFAIDNFSEIIPLIEKNSTINGFYKAMIKYLQVTLGKDVVVFFSNENEFYLIFSNMNETELREKILKLNSHKKFSGNTLYFSLGIIKYQSDYTFDTIIGLTTKAHTEAKKVDKEKNSVVFKIV